MTRHPSGVYASPRQVPVFVAAAIAFSWTLWFAQPLVASDAGAAITLDQLATFGPAAAAFLVVRGGPAAPAPARRSGVALAGLATLLATILLLAPRWAHAATPLAAALLAVLSAIPAALVVAAGSGTGGMRRLLGGLASPRSPWWTYVVAIALPPAASLAGTALITVLGGPVGTPPQVVSETFLLAPLAVFAVTLLFGGPLGEEIGWRGWLLPALQTRWSPLVSSLFVGLVWGAWHIPLHLRGLYDASMGSGLAGIALRLASSCLLAVLFTWLYNRAKGGLLVVILFHTSINNASGYWLPVNAGMTLVLLVTATVVALVDRMWVRPPVPEAGLPQPIGPGSSS